MKKTRGSSNFTFLIGGLISAALLSACAKGGFTPRDFSGAGKLEKPENPFSRAIDRLDRMPETTLRPMGRKSMDEEAPAYSVYRIKEVKARGTKKNTIIARVVIESSKGEEVVDLAGKIREDKTATLIDLNPRSAKEHRLTAEVECKEVDKTKRDTCLEKIVDVYYKVEGSKREIRRQFVDIAISEPEKQAPPKEEGPEDETGHTSLPDVDLDPKWRGTYVGATRNDEMINKLWVRPQDPQKEEKKEPEATASPSATPTPAPSTEESPVAPAPGQAAEPEDETTYVLPETQKPSENTDRKRPVPPTADPGRVSDLDKEETPAKTEDKSPDKKDEEHVIDWDNLNPPLPPPRPDFSKSDAEKPAKKAPAKKDTKTKDEEEDDDENLPEAPTAPPKLKQSEEFRQTERMKANFLELTRGGTAIGKVACDAQDRAEGRVNCGRIENASQIELEGPNWKTVNPNRGTNYGAGIMISFLKNAFKFFEQRWPGLTLWVNDVSNPKGGLYSTRHRSHQNGLDVDMAYIGGHWQNVVMSSGAVKAGFDYQKNWEFFQLAARQRLSFNDGPSTALHFVFVGESLKAGFCRYARNKPGGITQLDAEILRRMRVWSGHDDHFHLRLKCSPHYPRCYMQADPAAGDLGC